jgi:N-acetylneuraminic acid mutarotase
MEDYDERQVTHKKTISFDNTKFKSGSNYTPLSRTDFDPNVIDKWVEVRAHNAPKRRCNHISFIWNDYLYIFGGNDINEGKMSDFWKIKIFYSEGGDFTWQKIESFGAKPDSITNGAGVLYNSFFFLFGGENVKLEGTNDIFVYDIENNKWEKRMFIV